MRHRSLHFRRHLRDVGRWVWREQEDALHFGLKLQEETITEMLLLRMARDFSSSGLKVNMFNRIQEGGSKRYKKTGNGADWEWFIETDHCEVGFRIQAKVLSSGLTHGGRLSVGKYDGLLKDKKQTNDLITGARPKCFNPIYIFYNHPWISDRVLFSALKGPNVASPTEWGCSVSTASFILHQTDNRLSSLIGGMLPWHVFFGLGRGCVAQEAMLNMAGEQEFYSETPRPDWLNFMHDGPYAMDEYLAERDLAGVAYFKVES